MSRDRGSLSIEYVILTPFIFLVFGLIYVLGRVSSVDSSLDASTRDAARAASLAGSFDEARQVADSTVRAESGDVTSSCRSTLTVTFEVPNDDFAPGATLTVVSTCTYETADVLNLPGAPGGITVTSQFSAVIDPNRSLG